MNTQEPIAGWIFQTHLSEFASGEIPQSTSSVLWKVTSKAGDIKIAQPVFLWRAGGKQPDRAGIIGFGHIADLPSIRRDDAPASRLWRDPKNAEPALRVRVEVLQWIASPGDTIPRALIKAHPILSGVSIIRQPQGTNFSLNQEELDLLSELVEGDGAIVSALEKTLKEAAPDDVWRIQSYARRLRRGQKRFRDNLVRIHAGQCAMTGTKVNRVLHACHIEPHARAGNNNTANGILLRSDVHDLFDDRLITIDAESRFWLAPEIREAPEYSHFHGQPMVARDPGHPIDLQAVEERNTSLAWFSEIGST